MAGTGLAGTDGAVWLGPRHGERPPVRARRLRAAVDADVGGPDSRRGDAVRHRRRGPAAGHRPAHRGARVPQAAVRVRRPAPGFQPAGTAWSAPGTAGPALLSGPGSPPILSSAGFRTGPRRLIVELR